MAADDELMQEAMGIYQHDWRSSGDMSLLLEVVGGPPYGTLGWHQEAGAPTTSFDGAEGARGWSPIESRGI